MREEPHQGTCRVIKGWQAGPLMRFFNTLDKRGRMLRPINRGDSDKSCLTGL